MRRDFAVVGDSKGGAMGSDLVVATEEGRSPEFLVYALCDPKQNQFSWRG
ncbi:MULTISPECIES: DUF3604 domain-containing protein [Falsihalocynthiibacter]